MRLEKVHHWESNSCKAECPGTSQVTPEQRPKPSQANIKSGKMYWRFPTPLTLIASIQRLRRAMEGGRRLLQRGPRFLTRPKGTAGIEMPAD